MAGRAIAPADGAAASSPRPRSPRSRLSGRRATRNEGGAIPAAVASPGLYDVAPGPAGPSGRDGARGVPIAKPFHQDLPTILWPSPHQFLVSRRLERAAILLAGTDTPVTDVCYSVGFESPGSFSWLFRKRYGVSPLGYR